MDFIHLKNFKVRRPDSKVVENNFKRKKSYDHRTSPLSHKIFDLNDFPEQQFLPETVKKQSSCELEFDCLESDILNPHSSSYSQDVQNPGLKFIWDDEKFRRRSSGLDSQLDPPPSPDRPKMDEIESESYFFGLLNEYLKKRLKEDADKPALVPDSRIEEAANADLSKSFSDFNTQDWSLVRLLNDLQNDVGENSAVTMETGLGDRSLSESDDEPEDRERKIELENREIFEMTQEIERFSSDEDEFIPQLDGPPTKRKSLPIDTDYSKTEEIVLGSDSDSSIDSKIDYIDIFDDSKELLSNQSMSRDANPRDAQVWLTVASTAPKKSDISEWSTPNESEKQFKSGRFLSDAQANGAVPADLQVLDITNDSDSRDTFQSTLDDEANANANATNYTQLRAYSSLTQKPDLSEGFDSFEFVPETPPTSILNENFAPFRINVNHFGANLPENLNETCAKFEKQDLSMKFRVDSELEGPSLRNSFGFNATEMNLADAHVKVDDFHLCTMSMELHASTRSNLNPDPEFDPIRMLFYAILADAKNFTEIGLILVIDNLCDSIKAQVISYCKMNKIEFQFVDNEKFLFDAILDVIIKYDPDILVGYDIQQMSWGYLIERASQLKIDLCSKLSRIPEAANQSRYSSTDDWWSLADLHIAGRNCLNLWRLMRHELNLNVYTFENIAYHLLRLRIPKFAYSTLTALFNDSSNCYRVLDHFLYRVVGEAQFLIRTDLINRTCEFARIFGIQFFDVLSRGSQFRVESMMLRLTKSRNFVCVSPSVRQRRRMAAPECIPLNMEPESKFYTDPVLVLDFQSLYPSMCIAYNYCYSTCLGKMSNYNQSDQIEFGCTNLNINPSRLEQLKSDVHFSPAGVMYVKCHIRRGILPIMLEEILNTRFMIKQSMKQYSSDKNLMKILDARQTGLKLIANVTYGYTAANFSGRMPCAEVADSIVHKGRETLERAIALVNDHPDWKARVVYGDTDSMFVLLRDRTKLEAFEIGKKIADTVTKMNPKPVKLKFEKVFYPCVLQTKKRYVGYSYENVDQKEPIFDAKGIETVRRDACAAVSKMVEKCLHILFRTKSVDLVKQYTVTQFQKILRGRVSSKEFIFAKEYRGREYYSKDAAVPALVLAKKRMQKDRRSEPRVKERVPYVVVNGQPGCTLISCVRDPVDAALTHARLNYNYYIVKQIAPALNRVFSLLGYDVLTWYRSMPKSTRPLYTFGNKNKSNVKSNKRTLSQYFRLAECPSCMSVMSEPDGLCRKCLSDPQGTLTELETRCRVAERKYHYVMQICHNCTCASFNTVNIGCISLDCPIFHKRNVLFHDFDRLSQIRNLIQDCF